MTLPQTAATTMTVETFTTGWAVVDSEGGRWWPSEEALALVEAGADPVALCKARPQLGRWAQ